MVEPSPPPRPRVRRADIRGRLRRGGIGFAAAAAGWALLTLLTGGVSLHYGFVRLSSRNPRNPALLALLALVTAVMVAPRGARLAALQDDLRWWALALRTAARLAWRRWTAASAWLESRVPASAAPVLAIALAAGMIGLALRETAFVAAGSDAWGYVGQAHQWATGTLRMPEPLMSELGGFLPRDAFAPLAYRPSATGATLVPVTSPGLPLLMAIFERAAGAPAVFAVVPLLAALTVWATYLLGRRLHDRWAGVVAAALLAASPAFLFQLTSSPMSDIPAAAFWTLSLVAALSRTRTAAFWSGALAGGAILIRANLVPLAIIPGLLAARARAGGGEGAAGPLRAMTGFALGVLPAVLFIAGLYDYWYGSPLESGYGSLGQLYSAANLPPNLARYACWLLESETPVILLALAAPFQARDRRGAVALLLFAGAVAACYVFYLSFDAWWFLRFLLPAFPALLVLTAASLLAFTRRLPEGLRLVATGAVVGAVIVQMIGYASARSTFATDGEQKYAITGRYVASHLPRNAVIFSELYSGALRYYAGRPTIRFGLVPADHLEGAVGELRRRGYQPYLVAEDWEEEAFRRQFAGRNILTALVEGPDAELPLGRVRIYRLAR